MLLLLASPEHSRGKDEYVWIFSYWSQGSNAGFNHATLIVQPAHPKLLHIPSHSAPASCQLLGGLVHSTPSYCDARRSRCAWTDSPFQCWGDASYTGRWAVDRKGRLQKKVINISLFQIRNQQCILLNSGAKQLAGQTAGLPHPLQSSQSSFGWACCVLQLTRGSCSQSVALSHLQAPSSRQGHQPWAQAMLATQNKIQLLKVNSWTTPKNKDPVPRRLFTCDKENDVLLKKMPLARHGY